MIDLGDIANSIVVADTTKTEELTKVAIGAGTPAEEILNKGLVVAMQVVGEQFENGEIFLPELLMSGEAAKTVLRLVKPLFKKEGVRHHANKVVVGTVQGDVHDMGKNIVIMMLESNGWDVTDLGVDVAPETFCTAVKENNFQILGLSALLTSTMSNQEQTIAALKASGLRDKVKVAIGGPVVTQRYAEQIGADCYATDASDAVKKFKTLVQ